MLQLQRFTLDLNFNRKKLNDLISFPLLLNMNPFLDPDTKPEIFEELIKENPLNQAHKIIVSQTTKK
jgi:hypothetical protein